jgi:glycosyltransferase involved in cell wall biosynthesis
MRIVYVLTSLGVGGAEKQALAVAERMAKRGHAAALLVLRPRLPEEWPTALQVVYLGVRKRPGSVLVGLARARRFLLDFRPDLVHSHSFHANIFARLLRLLVPRLAVIATIHNVYEGGRPRMAAYRLTDGLSRRTAAVSEAAARRFVHLKAVSAEKSVVVRNGIDTAEFVPDPERRARVRSGMRTGAADASTEFIWLAAGRITPAKDYPNLLHAFAQVRTRRPDAWLWIAGEAADGEILPLRTLCAELGIGEAVRWLGLRRDIPALLDAADAFVSASAWEGMPLAVGEAMAMEKPIVASDAGGVRELVEDTGLVVAARDSEALAAAMIETMGRSRDELFAMGRAARERVVREFSMDAAADTWEAFYRALMVNAER